MPLFIVVLSTLKRNFNAFYLKMRFKIFLFIACFMVLLIFRLVFYSFLEFDTTQWQCLETIQGEIPLYISEILIALCYMFFMLYLYSKQKKVAQD